MDTLPPRPNLNTFELGSLRNQFLIAMPGMSDPHFAHSVTYICEHNADGAMGLIINHPLGLALSDIFEQLELTENNPSGHAQVLAGGPVSTERGFVLHPHTTQQWQSTAELSTEICLTTSGDILKSLAEGTGPAHYLVALGYAGWGGDQLEQEIADNAWLTVPANPQILFHTPVEQRWSAAARYLGIDLNLISSTAGHA
ncbi:YqgE/AlgH family protein [Gilvimarinus polysaccharolyticus]|uniref:YqgE/AlgH family protein n=1 Tax=Gilvimarinus polysaccharolyticus TaxID=863921 RepID=UPI0006737330|nr:YqgE/AlgH family protein [Gilvimarinus polysaccharolyticus]